MRYPGCVFLPVSRLSKRKASRGVHLSPIIIARFYQRGADGREGGKRDDDVDIEDGLGGETWDGTYCLRVLLNESGSLQESSFRFLKFKSPCGVVGDYVDFRL